MHCIARPDLARNLKLFENILLKLISLQKILGSNNRFLPGTFEFLLIVKAIKCFRVNFLSLFVCLFSTLTRARIGQGTGFGSNSPNLS